MDDVICMDGESVQQASAVDFLTVRVWEFVLAGLWPGRPCLLLQLSNMLTWKRFWGPSETVLEVSVLDISVFFIQCECKLRLLCDMGTETSVCIFALVKIKLNLWEVLSHTALECLQNASFCVSSHSHPTELLSVPPKCGLNPVHLCPYNAKEFLLGLILLVVFSPLLNNSSSFLFGFSSTTPPPLMLSLSSHLSLVCSLLILLIQFFFSSSSAGNRLCAAAQVW